MSLTTLPTASATHFARFLPDWLKAMHLRVQRLERDGWDINMLQLLHDDTQALAEGCERNGIGDIGARLAELHSQLHVFVSEQLVPHAPQSTQILRQLRTLAGAPAPSAPTPAPAPAAASPLPAYPSSDGFILDEQTQSELAAAFPQSAPAFVNELSRPSVITPATMFDDREFISRHPSTAQAARYTIYHFSDGNALARDFDPLLEVDGHDVSVFGDLASLLDALILEAPNLLVLDPTLLAHAATVQAAAQDRRDPTTMQLLCFCAADAPQQQLAAVRAKVDLLIVLPAPSDQVLARIRDALNEDTTPPRVMVVHDDTIQLLVTEDALGEAGMQPLALADPYAALAALETFRPDLIVIDLHRAVCDAVELIEMIRARPQCLLTPIMFLSSDHSPERRLQALIAGSDACLYGPVNSRHLVAEIRLRLDRARQIKQHFGAVDGNQPDDRGVERR